MNECWKNSEVAPGRVDDQNWQSVLHLWEPRNQDQTGRNLGFRNLGAKKTQVSGSPMNQKNGNPGN
jgi:hypothetical protein